MKLEIEIVNKLKKFSFYVFPNVEMQKYFEFKKIKMNINSFEIKNECKRVILKSGNGGAIIINYQYFKYQMTLGE